MQLNELKEKVDTQALLVRSLTDWYVILAKECQVYACEGNYLAKRFDEINYKFCGIEEATQILTDNLYVLLTYKYFTERSEQIDERITQIVRGFTLNLKRVLKRVSFDDSTDSKKISYLPNYCCAFRNGVYNFKDNCWFMRYNVTSLPLLNNKIYLYDENYAIMWYFNYDFEDLGISVADTQLKDFITVMQDFTKNNKNYCFELVYNMSHDSNDNFEYAKFEHLCEILGYTTLQSFSQHIVLLIGSGQNGKNSLFDGCFTNRVRPLPSALDLDTIEEDKFVTGTLENTCHNIFLETSPKIYTRSNMIKALTGSTNQSINKKGVPVYSGIINCKYIFAGNDKDNIKFKDNTTGFRRRLNLFEIFYHWDSQKYFLKRGDYYDTSFSDDLRELKKDTLNTTVFVYLAMYGIKTATNNFTSNFKFTYNDWSDDYADIDVFLKDKVNSIRLIDVLEYLIIYSSQNVASHVKLKDKSSIKKLAQENNLPYEKFLEKCIQDLQSDDIETKMYTVEMLESNIKFISIKALQTITELSGRLSLLAFTKDLKAAFKISNIHRFNQNLAYVECVFNNERLRLIPN